MKSLVWRGAHDVRVEDAAVPALGDEEALIRVGYAGICGSDVSIYAGKHWRAAPPLIMGHEFVGEIVEVRSARPDLEPGCPVAVEPLLPCGTCYACQEGFSHACRDLKLIGIDVDGGFAEYARAPVDRIHRLPEGVPLEEAALVEPVAVAVHAVHRSRASLDDDVLVLGAGPIGLLVAQVARVATSGRVQVAEIDPWRLDLARRLGFDAIDAGQSSLVDEVLRRTGGRGADVVFDAAGARSTAVDLARVTRIRGQVVVVAMPKEPLPVDLGGFAMREIDLVGCRVYRSSDFRTAIKLVARGAIETRAMVSHVLPLDRGAEGLQLAEEARSSMKVLLRP